MRAVSLPLAVLVLGLLACSSGNQNPIIIDPVAPPPPPPVVTPPANSTADDFVPPYTADFQYGTNPGYYGNGWTDDDLYGIAAAAGVRSTRSSLPDFFLAQYGTGIRQATFANFYNKLQFRENVLFIQEPRDPRRTGKPEDWCDHSTDVTYGPTNTQCKLWAGMYEPIWLTDSSGAKTVNPANKMALYVNEVVQNYGQYIRFYEVINEPDFIGNYTVADKWWTAPPTKADLAANLNADVFQYVRALRITFEVVKHARPDAYVAPGGIGYASFLDALLRYSDNPDAGKLTPQYPRTGGAYLDAVSFHVYPQYSVAKWDNSIGGFRYSRHSDGVTAGLLEATKQMRDVLNKYGYNGSSHPEKQLIVTELNIPRKAIGNDVGGDEVQRNFAIKGLVKAQAVGIRQVYWYALGENANLDSVNGFDLMGLYENLKRDAKGNQKLTGEGIAHRTISSQLLGLRYDAARTAALNLPATVDGAAFTGAGKTRLVLWAKLTATGTQANPTDRSEVASVNLNLSAVAAQFKVTDWQGNSSTINGTAVALTGAPLFLEAQ